MTEKINKLKVNSWHNGYGEIFLSVEHEHTYQDVTDVIFKGVLRTQEEAIREQLIALGWTPPKTEKIKPHGEDSNIIGGGGGYSSSKDVINADSWTCGMHGTHGRKGSFCGPCRQDGRWTPYDPYKDKP